MSQDGAELEISYSPGLEGWLAEQGYLDELRELLTGHRELLASDWEPTYGEHHLEVLRLRADLGDDNARQVLAHRLTRRRERAQAENELSRTAL